MHVHNIQSGSRNCIVCGKALEDAVSLSTGWGPVCRKKANEVLAKEIPANLALAQTIAASISPAEVPEVAQDTLSTVRNDVAAGQTTDWRATVKRCAWLLSFSPSAAFQAQVVNLVAALGYVGLAGLLTGEASTTEARLFFDEGRVHLAGARNKAGALAIKGAVKGWQFHPAKGETPATWSAPHAQAEAFLSVVAKFWPFAVGAEGVLEAMFQWEQDHPAPAEVPPPAPSAPAGKCHLVKVGASVQVFTPYSGAFIADLKTLPYKARAWDKVAKCWVVDGGFTSQVTTLIAKHYGEAVSLPS